MMRGYAKIHARPTQNHGGFAGAFPIIGCMGANTMNARRMQATGFTQPRLIARLHGAAALATTLLVGSLMLPDTAEARPSREGANVRLQHQRGRMPEAWVELTETGRRLEAEYAEELATLQATIRALAPTITSEQHEVFLHTLSDLASIDDSLIRGNRQLRNFVDYEQSVENFRNAEEAVEEARSRLASTQAFLDYARAMPDDYEHREWVLEKAERLLGNRNRDLERAPDRLEDARRAMESARQQRGELAAEKEERQNALEELKEELARVRAAGIQHLVHAGLADVLSSDELDTMLARFMVLNDADPYWLAVYAQQGREYEQRIERLLDNTSLMIRMLVADGPTFGRYGRAMEIYENIQQASARAREGVFERLALAVSLEHAQPLAAGIAGQDAHGGRHDENRIYIDPVERYLEYENAWLEGELDPDFDTHDVWNLRMVVDVYQTGEYLAWGRQMLRNYRPDLVDYPLDSLRYSKVVEEEIEYTSRYLNWGDNLGFDRDDLERMQNILANGGICGRRAHFGGYMLTAFGVPTTPRSQRGHAALVRYTPAGWVPYLGGGWGTNNREVRGYRSDADFRASTEARRDPDAFLLVKRAQWIGKAMGEDHRLGWGYRDGRRWRNREEATPPEPWNAVSSMVQEGIIQRVNPPILDAVMEALGESDESYDRDAPNPVEIPASEREISVTDAGVIHIPAAAASDPTNNTDAIRFMPSNLGGFQLHHRRFGRGARFEYTVDVPRAGTYALSARLVTPAWNQYLDLTVNGANEPIRIELPYTRGMWGELEPVRVELQKGTNVLTFSRMHYYFRGVSIRDFTLAPVN